ncbi:MAG: hypothetical protein KZQ83_18495 [gamma proteobacterium symbiont of Taylorina sp.]|nr:hypothetical protein [gamma proteobacterium symbiont of Taylorina sp.]
MKNIYTYLFALLLIFTIQSLAYASQKAITDTGEEIVIYSDGTWKHLNNIKQKAGVIQFNKNIFNKPKDSSFLLKSTTNKSAFWINTNKWSFNKEKNDTKSTEYKFRLKGKDLYGMAITEEIEIPIQSLTDIALSNAHKVAPDIKILKKEYRTVNGKKVIYMEMGGTMKGMKVTYLGYYYSDTYGTTQFLVYTATNLTDKYKPEINRFLNGLVTQ